MATGLSSFINYRLLDLTGEMLVFSNTLKGFYTNFLTTVRLNVYSKILLWTHAVITPTRIAQQENVQCSRQSHIVEMRQHSTSIGFMFIPHNDELNTQKT